MENWNDKKEVKKGTIGEQIVKDYFASRGYVVYLPATDGSHIFDGLLMRDKKELAVLEIKTKARRNYYADTGINISHYNEYKKISESHNLIVRLFFVDEMIGAIYGGNLDDLEKAKVIKNKPYPSFEKNIVFFPLCNMKKIRDLTPEESVMIKNHNTRNYKYREFTEPCLPEVK